MAQEKSFINETCKRGLINRRRVLVHCAADFDQRIDQLLRRNDVAQPQGRIKNLTSYLIAAIDVKMFTSGRCFTPCVMLPTLQMLAARYEGTEQDRSRGRSDRVYRRV